MSDANPSKPANFLEALSSLGAELHRDAHEAGEELRRHMVGIRRKAPALLLTPRPATDLAWADEPQVHETLRALQKAGFVHDGAFEYPEIPDFASIGFLHPPRGVLASVSRTAKGCVIDLESRHTDGTVYEITNAPVPAGIPHPSWLHRQYIHGGSLQELLRQFEAGMPASPQVPARPGDYIRWTVEGHHRIQLWRSERGGWDREEIRRQRGWVPEEDTDERLEQLELARHENLERWLYNWLRCQPGLPFDPAEVVESLVLISDAHADAMALAVWTAGTKGIEIGRGRFESGRPRAEFAELNAERGQPLRLIWQKSTPPAADFYLPLERPRAIASTTPLGEALNIGLLRGDLRRSLLAVAGQEIQSAGDAQSLIEALRHLAGPSVRNRAREVQAVARMFGFARNEESEAFRILRTDGAAVLAALYDRLFAELDDGGESGDAVLGVLKVVSTLDPAGSLHRVLEAARRPLAPDGMAWTALLRVMARDLRTQAFLLDGLSNPLPGSSSVNSLLAVSNEAAGAEDSIRHPFNSPAGLALLESWIGSADPDDAGRACAAVDALPHLTGCESLYTQALAHPDADVRFTAARQLAAAGRAEGMSALVEACGHLATAARAREILTEIQREDAIPAAARVPDFVALSDMAAWLAHPSELGRMPEELEIIDRRTLPWPPERAEKSVWLIRFRARAGEDDESETEGWGLAGTVTFSLFSYELHTGTIEDAYAVHCAWEMQQAGLIEEAEVDDDSDEHQGVLRQWTGDPVEGARVILVMQPSGDLGLSTEPIGLARVGEEDAGDVQWLVLDGPRSHRVPADSTAVAHPSVMLLRHLGRRLLGMGQQR